MYYPLQAVIFMTPLVEYRRVCHVKAEKTETENLYYRRSTLPDREILLQQKYTISQIAGTLGIKYHTLYHEIKRGKVKQLDTLLAEHYVYKADYAQRVCEESLSHRGRNLKIGSDFAFVHYIEDMIHTQKYSPEALIQEMKNRDICFSTTLCYKTIYNYLDMGLFLNTSNEDLMSKKKKRPAKEKRSSVALNNRTARLITERPAGIAKRDVYGHWEMDTVVSAKNTGLSCLLVLSERMTREEIIVKIKNKKSSSVVHALNMLERKLGSKSFREKFKTITCDNGVEFLDMEGIEKSRYTKGNRTMVYYCHPYSSYERGTNENINRMIRRFFPKGTNFDLVTKKQVQLVEAWINHYPRKIFGGISSAQYRKNLKLTA